MVYCVFFSNFVFNTSKNFFKICTGLWERVAPSPSLEPPLVTSKM